MRVRHWVATGDPWVWLNASAVTICVLLVAGLIGIIAARGLGHFWPSPLERVVLSSEEGRHGGSALVVMGQARDRELVAAQRLRDGGISLPDRYQEVTRELLKVGNRDLSGQDFVWLLEPFVEQRDQPADAVIVERNEWGDFIGFISHLQTDTGDIDDPQRLWPQLRQRIAASNRLAAQIRTVERDEIGRVNQALEALRLEQRRLQLENELSAERQQQLERERVQLNNEYQVLSADLTALKATRSEDLLHLRSADGQILQLPLSSVRRAYRPNAMSFSEKLTLYGAKLWEFVSEDPREANTEGGVFPAIFGTVIMVILMSVIVTPFGVIAAIYLHEYAGDSRLTQIVRIGVNNLAGVPSIVYGVFGLGLFVYVIGGSVDQLFYPEALPAPTYGTGGLLWASMTLAVLTLPVVIVATEEGLTRIPPAVREGSFALGANKSETLRHITLPMASPAIMTGVILAVARAAGEVAPLMLVGVVKLAPSLPLDSVYPFLHPERKFMHLGFHIYDVGFQSPNVEASRPLVFSTALLLLLVILCLNVTAISIRNRLRDKFSAMES